MSVATKSIPMTVFQELENDTAYQAMKVNSGKSAVSSHPTFYIAGPFFNAPQLQLIVDIELAFVDACVPYFSPRNQSANEKKSLDDKDARDIYKMNIFHLDGCDAMIAVVDFLLPENQALSICSMSPGKRLFAKKPIELPDSGTVYEMGYYAAQRKPVILFTTKGKDARLNLMLTQGCMGVIYGLDNLKAYLKTKDNKYVERYTGKHI